MLDSPWFKQFILVDYFAGHFVDDRCGCSLPQQTCSFRNLIGENFYGFSNTWFEKRCGLLVFCAYRFVLPANNQLLMVFRWFKQIENRCNEDFWELCLFLFFLTKTNTNLFCLLKPVQHKRDDAIGWVLLWNSPNCKSIADFLFRSVYCVYIERRTKLKRRRFHGRSG